MRETRVRKYKNRHKKICIVVQLMAFWYISLFLISSLTTSTSAYFIDSNKISVNISAGTWWDGSVLEFPNEGNQNLKSCPNPTVEISVKLKNNGFTMIGQTVYEVYYIEEGDPRQNGKKVGKGSIGPIQEGEETIVKYAAQRPGFYMFKVLQRPDFKHDSKNNEIWSEKIKVDCKKNQEIIQQNDNPEEVATPTDANKKGKTQLEKETDKVDVESSDNVDETRNKSTQQDSDNEKEKVNTKAENVVDQSDTVDSLNELKELNEED